MIAEAEIDTQAIDTQAGTALAEATQFAIEDNAGYTLAIERGKALAGLEKLIDMTFDPIIKAAHTAHKQAVATKNRHAEPVERAKLIYAQKIGAYRAAQEAIRQEAERKARAEAQRKAEDEALRKAEALAKQGKQEQAEAVLSKPVVAAPVVIAPTTPDVKGASSRTNWKFRIVNENSIPREYLIPDEKKIGQVVRAMKDATKIAGVEVYADESTSFRS